MKIWMSLLPFFFAGYLSVSAQSQTLAWTPFTELNEKLRENPKPILVFIHTDWCKYCLMQEKNTFTDPEIVDYLNEQYYCLKLNGETKESLRFLNRNYSYISTGAGTGQHQLAELLGKKEGVLTYPTTVILSNSFQLQARESGFLDKNQLISMLRLGESFANGDD